MSSDRKDVSSTNEEDDLDGLDDVLDEFTAKPQPSTSTSTDTTNEQASTSTSNSKPSISSTATATTEDEDLDAEFDEEAFAKELEANMAALMKTFSGGDDSVPPSTQPSEKHAEHQANEIEMMRQFEAMMNEMGLGNENGILGGGGGAAGGPSSSSQPSSSNGTRSTPTPANYQEALKATMSRLKESDASASASASGNHNNPLAGMFPGLENDEEMKKLLATLSGGGEGGEDGESPEFAKMLENMMGELMGKEVLYEPMKELSDKYQPFLDNPPRPLSDEDKTRFQKQAKIVKEVVALFEDPKFDNGTEEEKRKLKNEVGEKMNEMQECGAPPDEVAGEMPEGMEGIPGLDGNPENCLIM